LLHSDQNLAARTQNSLLRTINERLSALTNPGTGTPIPGFPATSERIQNMNAADLHSVLRELGLGIDGPKELKQQRLRLCIGLPAHPGA
jgi:hypothetical protein